MVVPNIHVLMANTMFTQKSTCLTFGIFGRYQASKVDNSNHYLRFNSKIQHHFSVSQHNHGFRIQKHNPKRKMQIKSWSIFCAREPREAPTLVDRFRDHWKSWILGTIFTILLSFITRGKWGPLLLLKVETTIEKAEQVANIVEEVAERVDKMAERTAKNLPKGKRRVVAEFVENVAEDVEKIAQNAEDALEKVENMEKELESFMQSSTDHHEKLISPTESKDKK
ncbi:phage capsid scaffolding protein (GPO) serine peptidase [Medicago truncatula]|uniref:Phage capsid scaffolding protein (GPO) serine peptidase n=1 Tax=Medicago truncatula TaxID=3880 RepID=G7KAI7_MEDTR|nr:phage capsid scaffolding protein (GPO) serine peptidase [Medicago truncatula]